MKFETLTERNQPGDYQISALLQTKRKLKPKEIRTLQLLLYRICAEYGEVVNPKIHKR